MNDVLETALLECEYLLLSSLNDSKFACVMTTKVLPCATGVCSGVEYTKAAQYKNWYEEYSFDCP